MNRMEKLAFFYELGYNMVKEAEEKKPIALLPAPRVEKNTPEDAQTLLNKLKGTGTEAVDIWKALLGVGRGETAYGQHLKDIFSKASLGGKGLAIGAPLAALGAIGYGVRRATRKKSKMERLLESLGVR